MDKKIKPHRQPPSKTPHPKFQCYTKLYSSSGFDFFVRQTQVGSPKTTLKFGVAGTKNQTLNLNRVLCNIEIWGVGFYLVDVCTLYKPTLSILTVTVPLL